MRESNGYEHPQGSSEINLGDTEKRRKLVRRLGDLRIPYLTTGGPGSAEKVARHEALEREIKDLEIELGLQAQER